MIQPLRNNNVASPGANAVATLYDDSGSKSDEATYKARVEIELLADQVVTINTDWADLPSSPLRLLSSAAQTASARCTQRIMAVAKANLVNTDYFTVVHTRTLDGVATTTTVIYEFMVVRSEEHTSELQSRQYLVCRLLLEK